MPETNMPAGAADRDVITLGGGCFWCLEAVFEQLQGVDSVVSGYAGGTVANPSYQDVCTGTTGHAEVVQITFDPKAATLRDLLRVFFTIHDPTTRNRQGGDVGPQYRSIILYRNQEQQDAAREVIREIAGSGIWDHEIVTELVPLKAFYQAENYHQEYFENNPAQPYCRAVIVPKVMKFREKFRDRLKKKPAEAQDRSGPA